MYRTGFILLILAMTLVTGCATAPEPGLASGAAAHDMSARSMPYPSADVAGTGRELSFLRLSPEPPASGTSTASDRAIDRIAPGAADTQSPARSPGAAGAIVLGEGDVIEFRMFGQPDMTTTGYVSADGTVSLPLLQQFHVGGLTPGQAQRKIATAYRDGGYFNDPQINITITQYRSQQISVLGEVNKPGRYPLETQTGVLEALAQAGGVTPKAASTVIAIDKTGDGARRYRLNMKRLIADSGQRARFMLSAGDIVFVPEAPLFYIYGEVRRPDAYPLTPRITVRQALSIGGGLTDRGSNSRIVIHREENGQMRSFKPDLSDHLKPDDVIYVKERFF